MNIIYQRHPTNPACVIVHIPTLFSSTMPANSIEVEDQEYRNALEIAGVLTD